VAIAAERGLRTHVRVLADMTRNERDETVLAALAEAVVRNQWEPSDSQGLLELRLWAQTRFAPVASERVPAGAPTPPLPQASVAQTAAGDAEWRARDSAAIGTNGSNGNGRHRRDWDPSTTTDPVQVEQLRAGLLTAARPRPAPPRPRIIVTGAGGPAGVAVVKALIASGDEVIAVDADGLAAGLRLATACALVPQADAPMFAEAIRDVAIANNATAIVSTVAEELPALIDASRQLEEAGVAVWLPPARAVEICLDKWLFARVAVESGIRVPTTNLGSANGVAGTWVVKPRQGRGGRDVYFVDRHSDLAWALQHVPEPIVQTRLTGREFTVDALVDRDGTLVGAVPRWRLDVRAGVSVKGRTFENQSLIDAVARLIAVVGLTGPCNVQGFMAHDGTVTFVEVNPRFSGGLPLSLAAGADLVGEYLRAVLGDAIRPARLRYRPGVTMIRHYDEIFE
jgi:carbamoyl-phosphate synthase large subunit